MTENPYLQHLIPDPHFGYLFPHRLALAAFGVPNDYHLRKHYPQLVDGQHYLKIRGSDHVERLFYTLIGLLTLSDLLNTPQSQAFKQALIAHTQSGGPIVPSPTQAIAPPSAEPTLTLAQSNPTPIIPAIAPSPNEPAYLVAQYLQPEIERALERTLIPRLPIAAPPQTPQDTAAIIFEAQRLATEQAQQTAQTLLNAQRLMAEQPTVIHLTIWERADTWLSQQDTWAMSLIAAAVVALTGISAYFFVATAIRQTPTPNYPIQPQEVTP